MSDAIAQGALLKVNVLSMVVRLELEAMESAQHLAPKRLRIIEILKDSDTYRESRARASSEEPAPATPDPTDRSISKRSWDKAVFAWKRALLPQ